MFQSPHQLQEAYRKWEGKGTWKNSKPKNVLTIFYWCFVLVTLEILSTKFIVNLSLCCDNLCNSL
jgi:hypothetical protein